MQASEIPALIRACKYSLIPNSLGYCGAKNYSHLFNSFIQKPTEKRVPIVKNALRTFIGAHSYIKLIAEHHSLNKFSEEAIEAYWLGSDLLNGIPVKKVKRLINESFKTLPESIRLNKTNSLPNEVFPHHSFHVLFVEFLTPKLKALVKNLNKCIVGWGKVRKKRKEKIEVKGIELFSESNRLKLRECIKRIENPFFLNIEKGELISVHWNNAIEGIHPDQVKRLEGFTLKNLELANSVR